MPPHEALRINTPNVIGEEFEGEVVVVNLETGCYFSLMGSAKDVWKRLAQGSASPEAIVSALSNTLDCSGIDIAPVIFPFLDELKGLELVVAVEGVTSIPSISIPEQPDGVTRPLFETPRIETFNDLQDILLLDPIHDVDEAGWPVADPTGSAPE